MNIDSFASSFHKYLMHFYRRPPAGARHLAHGCVATLEKGETIACELRLAVNQMTNSHW